MNREQKHFSSMPQSGSHTDPDAAAIVRLLDQMAKGGDSRMKVVVAEDEPSGSVKREYHHGRCDIGSPWAKGECWDLLEDDEGKE